jgi:hypothetical protein
MSESRLLWFCPRPANLDNWRACLVPYLAKRSGGSSDVNEFEWILAFDGVKNWRMDRTAPSASAPRSRRLLMGEEHSTAAVRRCLDALAGDQPASELCGPAVASPVRESPVPELPAFEPAAIELAARRSAGRRGVTSAKGMHDSPADGAPLLRSGQSAHALGAK